MKQQIEKLLKRQTRLKFDELLILSELEEDELEKILQNLISEEVIKKVGDEYIYILPLIAEAHKKSKKKKFSGMKKKLSNLMQYLIMPKNSSLNILLL